MSSLQTQWSTAKEAVLQVFNEKQSGHLIGKLLQLPLEQRLSHFGDGGYIKNSLLALACPAYEDEVTIRALRHVLPGVQFGPVTPGSEECACSRPADPPAAARHTQLSEDDRALIAKFDMADADFRAAMQQACPDSDQKFSLADYLPFIDSLLLTVTEGRVGLPPPLAVYLEQGPVKYQTASRATVHQLDCQSTST